MEKFNPPSLQDSAPFEELRAELLGPDEDENDDAAAEDTDDQDEWEEGGEES